MLGISSLSQLFYDSLALSAWKAYQESRWALRVNPSSGNLHPTEGYLICGEMEGLPAGVYHYLPADHALEQRCELPADLLAKTLPEQCILMGLSSILWREAWKYGERSFRYCQHDIGHAVAAIAIAAAILGWEARLLEGLPDPQVAVALGIGSQKGVEAEHPDALLVLAPRGSEWLERFQRTDSLPGPLLEGLRQAVWQGSPNQLSAETFEWRILDEVAQASLKREPPPSSYWKAPAQQPIPHDFTERPAAARALVRQRRSAVELDGRTRLGRTDFYRMLTRLQPQGLPFSTLPWKPAIHLGLFVHRVDDLQPGLYLLVRDEAERPGLQAALHGKFVWSVPERCPKGLGLYLLEAGDLRRTAAGISCGQNIAGDGVFAVAMLARFHDRLQANGAWFYRRLHWEAGAIGQMLYLEAEAAGIRGTGIGCFYDDATHRVFGLSNLQYHDLYHFTVGGPLEDSRLQTQAPYPEAR